MRKLPVRHGTHKCNVHFVVTITTDLGDIFYPADTDIHVSAISSDGSKCYMSKFVWRAGMRALPIKFLYGADWTDLMAFEVSTEQSGRSDSLQIGDMPEIVAARSTFKAPGYSTEVADVAERIFSIGEESSLCIREEVGESIARHIWHVSYRLPKLFS